MHAMTQPDIASQSQRGRTMAAGLAVLLLAGVAALAVGYPLAVIGTLLAAIAAVGIVRYPIQALGALLLIAPFHGAIFAALQARSGHSPGALGYWKDGVILAIFARALARRVLEDRRMPFRNAGDNVLLFYCLAFVAIAIVSPARASVYPSLGRYVEGPLLLLTIRYLRPSRKELWFMAATVIGAAAIIGAAAVIEWYGPRLNFHRWYGINPPPDGRPFILGTGYRSGSFIYDPLVLGFYLAGTIPFAVAISAVRTRWRPVALLAAVTCIAGLIASLTRSGYVGGGVGLLIALALVIRNPGVRLSLIGMIVVISASLTGYYVAGGNEAFIRSESNELHRQTIEQAFNRLQAQPYGYGLGTTDRNRFREGTINDPGQLGPTESTYLARALEGGVQGLFLYLIALFVTGMRLRSARRRALDIGDRAGTAFAAGSIGAMIAVGLCGLFLGVLELPVEIILWVPAGIALAWTSMYHGGSSVEDLRSA